MSLYKIGSHLKILKTAAVAEDLLVDRPLTEKKPDSTKVIEPKHTDFLYYRARAISAGDQGPLDKEGSRGWNYNGNFDYFPRKQLEASYETFVGRNIFLDHNSESSLYSIGKIIDAVPVDDPETGEFYIELVGKIDRTLHPEICRKIETGELNSTSMGCSVDESKCSICGHVLHSDADDKCEHLSAMGLGKKFQAEINAPEFNIKLGDMVPAFSINSGIVFNEDSIVGVPADPSAVIKTVLSNVKSRLTKKASLTKEEQLDLATQMEKLFEKLDESTKIQLKAEFCGVCPTTKESSMSEQNLPNEDTKKILSKLSALEMEQLESYVQHKTKKANEIVHKEVVSDAAKKEENFLQKVIAKVKHSFAAELLEKKIETIAKDELEKEIKKPSISAKFQEDKNNVLDSTWSVNDGEKEVLNASLKDIWGSTFETLSFEDQKWATSADYAKEVVSRYERDGIEKLADLWDVTHKLTKTAKGPELGPDGSFAKPSTGSSNKEHDVKNSPVEKPGQEKGQKGPAAPAPEAVKTETKLDMPGQEKGQTGPAAPKAKEVKTDYAEPKSEGGEEVTTTPKNPEEKKVEKTDKEIKTDYVAAGTEAMEAEEKDKKESKKESSLISWTSLTPKAQEFIKTAAKKYIDNGMKNVEAVAKAHSEFTAQETIMEKKAADKPVESVDGSTLPEGTKTMGDKVEESVQGTTVPGGAAPTSAPETSAQGDKEHKTPNLTKAPDEAVDGTTLPPQGKKDEESVETSTHPDGKKSMGTEPDMAVNKSAATEMPTPEMATEDVKVDEIKPEHETETMSLDPLAPKVDAPKEEVSAFDKAETLDIGEGYAAHKDKESKEIIVEKDGKEVKRLPDGFGSEVVEVLKLMKAVLGLPAEEATMPAAAPVISPDVEAPKADEHPGLEEAHEDELGIKESALNAKEAALAEKEAAITAKEAELKAKEDSEKKADATKKFASIIQARSERCRTIVSELVDKGQLSYDKTVYESELKNGSHLLDARKKAYEAAITAKMKEFMALNDDGLGVMEATVKSLQAPVATTNVKKASHIFVSPAFTAELSEDEEIAKIFKSMGTKNHPQ